MGARLALLATSLLVSFLAAELAWRLVMNSETETGQRLRNPMLYGDPFSDDFFWKLRYRWQSHVDHFRPPENPHPLLGWASAPIREDFSHALAPEAAGRRPVLLYGDSFAQGMQGTDRFQKLLNRDPEFADFARDHYFLNYGVGGYGVGQIYLLFQRSIDLFEDPFVIFSVMTFDLDRSVLSVRIGQKPYFEVENGALELRGVPIDSDPHRYYAENPPEVGSYLLRRLRRLPRFRPDEDGSAATARKKEVNGAIFAEAIRELEARELDYVIFVFHARKALRDGPDWRSAFLEGELERHGAPYLWSYDILRSRAPNAELDELFDPKTVHPTSLANRIFARAMAERVRADSADESAR
ncbi:MAG: hypothetical protein AAF725_08690 [Acidobacteriota bacterium]